MVPSFIASPSIRCAGPSVNMTCCGGGAGAGTPAPTPVPPGRELGRLTADLRTRSLLLHEIDAVVTVRLVDVAVRGATDLPAVGGHRSEEHTSELQSPSV